ncbi:MAG: quinol:electron acceptor oxidoreductase subunit ActD [Thermanaerothrix sp.]|uniref:quinol:electron acceptor oxidoreductase subunit ActD n=1 Tax=Thermanaerothrix sp. TaxID=2972675 RepID=UPI003C7D8F84
MSANMVHLALFKETAIDHAAEAITRLREMGVSDRDISVISGIPYSERILGRPMAWTTIGRIGLAGAVVGFLVAVFLSFGTPLLYPIRVAAMPFQPIPTSIVVIFELTMLGLLISTFIGVFVETISPSFGPRGYHPKVSDGHIGILFSNPAQVEAEVHAVLEALGAEIVHNVEEERLWP